MSFNSSTDNDYTAQFGDPSIRRFNLVAVDLRSHGETSGPVPEGYDQEMATKDVIAFMVRS
jgi:pimeloyl-ACP methyl ester carboxylesterase